MQLTPAMNVPLPGGIWQVPAGCSRIFITEVFTTTSGESKPERTRTPFRGQSKPKKAFRGPKMSVSAPEQSFRNSNDALPDCIIWSRAELRIRWPTGELTALPRSSQLMGRGLAVPFSSTSTCFRSQFLALRPQSWIDAADV